MNLCSLARRPTRPVFFFLFFFLRFIRRFFWLHVISKNIHRSFQSILRNVQELFRYAYITKLRPGTGQRLLRV